NGNERPASALPGAPRGQTAAGVKSAPPLVEYQTVGAVSSSGSTPAATIRPPPAVTASACTENPSSPARAHSAEPARGRRHRPSAVPSRRSLPTLTSVSWFATRAGGGAAGPPSSVHCPLPAGAPTPIVPSPSQPAASIETSPIAAAAVGPTAAKNFVVASFARIAQNLRIAPTPVGWRSAFGEP